MPPMSMSMSMTSESRSGAAPFTPASIAGLWSWHKGNTGLYSDTAGTVPASANGDAVQRINDLSGNSRNALLGGVGAPVRSSTDVGLGGDSVRFPAGQTVGLNIASTPGTSFTLLMRLACDGGASNRYIVQGNTSPWQLGTSGAGDQIVFIHGGIYAVNGPARPAGSMICVTWQNPSVAKSRVNGVTNAGSIVNVSPLNTITIGAGGGTFTAPSAFYLRELLIYSVVLNEVTEIPLLETYMNTADY